MKRGTHPNSQKNLKPIKRGEVRNPLGINRKRPITAEYTIIATNPVPEPIRKKINAAIGDELLKPGDTWAKANAIRRFIAAVIETGGHVDSKEIREAIEGKAEQRIEVVGLDSLAEIIAERRKRLEGK